MSIVRVFNGANLFKPGAYSRTRVNLAGGFPLAATGVVAIIGEAEGGEPGSSAGLLRFTSEDVASIVDTFKSGPIVDAARILVSPARDGRVSNGASQIVVYKTNASTQSSLTLQNSAATDLMTLTSRNFGEDENLISAKVESGVTGKIITIKKGTVTEVLSENASEDIMSIQYTGANLTATLTIQNNILAVDAGGADDISVSLANKTIEQVVELIDANANFSASSSLQSQSFKSATDLDPISTATDVKTSSVTLKAVQRELFDIINSESQFVTASFTADVEGSPADVAKTFLTGAAKGASTNTAFQAAFDALLAQRVNTVIPLISRDASDLLLEGLTDPSSTFDVDSVNLQALTHCITASNTKNRSERNCYVSFKGSFADSQTKSKALNHERAAMLFQDVEVLASSGSLEVKEPWAAACIVAGIQAGTAVGEPATFKLINANGISHEDYNSKSQVDLAIQAGLTPLEELDSGGFRVVVGNTTYNKDANFVFNRVSVLEAADYVAYNLRKQLEDIFTGTKSRTGTAEAIKNTTVAIMSTFLNEEIIVGDDTNESLGYKDLVVTIQGNTAFIDVTITPVQGVDFILTTITLDDIRQSA